MKTLQFNDKEKNKIFLSNDIILEKSELTLVINKIFGIENVEFLGRSIYKINTKKGIEFFCFKNITYLGNPHAIWKKRIQIDVINLEEWLIKRKINISCIIFVGIYNHSSSPIFSIFNMENMIEKKSKNSSLHVSIFQIAEAFANGTCFFTDKNKNKISVYSTEYFKNYWIESNNKIIKNKSFETILKETCDYFFKEFKGNYDGISCYDEMIFSDFSQARQAEWPGFYLEYRFGKFLKNKQNGIHVIRDYDKGNMDENIDLDLWFENINSWGDLKMHSLSSTDNIPGNDYESVKKIIDDYEKDIYYIIISHTTEMDKNNNLTVTRYWNKMLNKDNLESYSTRMKHSIDIKDLKIIKLTPTAFKYLNEFKQGHNSGKNKNLRNKKILLNLIRMSDFVIHEVSEIDT